MVGNKNVPFGIAVGLIVLVAGIVGAGIYCQSVSLPDADPVVVPVMKPQAVPEKTTTTKTFRNDAYGLEFTYSPEWGDINMVEENPEQFFIEDKDGNWIFQLDTQTKNPGENDFYNIPKGTDVNDWVQRIYSYEDTGDGYFYNRVGSGFDIAGLKTLHLVSRPQKGGSHDEFYFVKDGRLFVLRIVNDPSMREELELDDESQWYTQLLKSFRASNS